MSPLNIAIIGAGPAGCMLARILSQSSVSSSLYITVFEGETSLNVRSQGGTLDLRQGTGLEAMRAANLMPEFDKYARYEGESLVICDKYLTKYLAMVGDSNDKNARAPEIDRFKLRQLLLDSLPEGTIRWGKRLSKVTEEEKEKETGAPGSMALHFADGTVADGFDLMVGADGAWSKVRPLVSDVKPFFSGVGMFSFTMAEASTVAPETVQLINGGNVFSMHDSVMLSQQQMGDDTLQIMVDWPVDGSDGNGGGDDRWMQTATYDTKDIEAVKKYLLNEKLKGWDPALTNAIRKAQATNTQLRSDSLYMLPVGHTWTHRRGVTLIGDAAHLMTPFAGEGVNQALTDAHFLAREIIDAISSSSFPVHGNGSSTSTSTNIDNNGEDERATGALDAAVARYEKEAFSRSAKIMAVTQKLKNLSFFTPGGLYRNIEEWIITVLKDGLPLKPLTVPLATAAIHVYYFFFRHWHRARP